MMNGKQKCAVLKEIRRDIARANEIKLEIPECKHTGDCLGTCPRCESEVRFLERALDARRKRGLKIVIAGISAGLIAVSSASCDVFDALVSSDIQGDMMPPELDGDIEVVEQTGSIDAAAEDGILIAPEALAGVIPVEEIELQGDVPMEVGE